MTWFKNDDQLHSHPKMVEASLEAAGLWVLAGSYCADKETDGHVSYKVAERLGGERAREAAADLVRVGLWEVTPTGWLFHDWLDYNPSAAELRAHREAQSSANARNGRLGGLRSAEARRSEPEANGEAVRSSESEANLQANLQANHEASSKRAPKRTFKRIEAPDPDPVNPEVTPLTPQGGAASGPRLVEVRREAETQTDGTFGMTADAFRDGIKSVTGACAPLAPRDRKAVQRLIEGHCAGLRGQPLIDAVRAIAVDFAQAVDTRYRTLTADNCVAWLNSGRPMKPPLAGSQTRPGGQALPPERSTPMVFTEEPYDGSSDWQSVVGA